MAVNPALQYARDVVAGRIVAGPYVRAECRRHIRDRKRIGKDLYWDAKAGRKVQRFFEELLQHFEGQFDGEPFILEPSQLFILWSLFAWKMRDPDRPKLKPKEWPRRFRRAYVEQGKGNGKSPLGAGIGLYLQCADDERGAEIYAGATTMDQADIVFQQAVSMGMRNPLLARRLNFIGGKKKNRITYIPMMSFFKCVSGKLKRGGSGLKPHGVIIDELHEHPNDDVLEVMERGFKWRRQPLLVMLTNSGTDRNSVCYEERALAIAVATGRRKNDRVFSYVCALDKDDDPVKDESCWIKANPLLGVTISRDYLRDEVLRAKQIPRRLNRLKRWNFCIWTGSVDGWIEEELWNECEDDTLDIADFEGARCWGGLDLAAKKDLTAKALVFEDGTNEAGDPCYAAFLTCYTPADTVEVRENKDKAPYQAWIDQGFLVAVPGKKLKFDRTAQDLVEDDERYLLEFVAFDRHLSEDFIEVLDECGGSGITMVSHPQGWQKRSGESNMWMPGSIDIFETLIIERRIRFNVNPVLRMASSGAVFRENATSLVCFDKRNALVRIDAIVALTMACGASQETGVYSPWDDEDFSIHKNKRS